MPSAGGPKARNWGRWLSGHGNVRHAGYFQRIGVQSPPSSKALPAKPLCRRMPEIKMNSPDEYEEPPRPGAPWEDHVDYWRSVYGTEASFVYVIRAGYRGPIKVGLAKNPESRLREHQTSNHEELTLLHVLPGGRSQEAELHRRLKHARLRGEWFAGPEVSGFLKWVSKHAEDLVSRHELFNEVPSLDLTPKPRNGRGIPSGAFLGHGLQSRWRLGDSQERQVKVSFVDPESIKPPEQPKSDPRPIVKSTDKSGDKPWCGQVPDWLTDRDRPTRAELLRH